MDDETRGLLDTLRGVLGFNDQDSSRLVRILTSCGALASGAGAAAALMLTRVERGGMGGVDLRVLAAKILAVGAAYAVPYAMCRGARNEMDQLMQGSKTSKSDNPSLAQLKVQLDKLLRMDAEVNRSEPSPYLI